LLISFGVFEPSSLRGGHLKEQAAGMHQPEFRETADNAIRIRISARSADPFEEFTGQASGFAGGSDDAQPASGKPSGHFPEAGEMSKPGFNPKRRVVWAITGASARGFSVSASIPFPTLDIPKRQCICLREPSQSIRGPAPDARSANAIARCCSQQLIPTGPLPPT
jgi:hypothetical protein